MYKILRTLAPTVRNNIRSIRPSSTLQTTTTTTPSQNNDEPIELPTNPFEKERQKCILCKMNITPDHKNVKLLSQFQSPYTGQIYGRHITGLCKRKQEEVEKAIIRAQNCAMMPTYHKDMDFLEDPSLFDPERPLRPHKY